MKKRRDKLEAGLRELRSFIKACAAKSASTDTFLFRRTFFRAGLGALALDEKENDLYERIVRMLCPDKGAPHTLSRATVESWLEECILSALDLTGKQTECSLDQRIDAAINSLREKLTAPLIEWEVWQPVEKLTLKDDVFEFGKVLFCSQSHGLVRQTINRVASLLRGSTSGSSADAMVSAWMEGVAKRALCRIIVKAADARAAQEVAAVELDTTAAVLNFFASLCFPEHVLPLVCPHGDLPSYRSQVLAFDGVSRAHLMSSLRRVNMPLDLNRFRECEPIRQAMEKASAMLRDEGEGEYRERLVTAMKWAGKGATADKREDAFLFYAIALEALLLGGKHDEQLSYRLRLRAAHVLGSSTDERKEVRDRVKRLYELRSTIVHTGRSQIPETDLSTLRFVTQVAILQLMSDSRFAAIDTDEALEDWFEQSLM